MRKAFHLLVTLVMLALLNDQLRGQSYYDLTGRIDTTGLIWTGKIKNGQRYGQWNAVSKNNTLCVVANYRKGVLNGTWTEYYTTGERRESGTFKNGKREGNWYAVYPNQDTMIVANYTNGILNGTYIDFYQSKQIRSQGSYADGKRIGTWMFSNLKKSSREITIANYTNDTLDGKYEKLKDSTVIERLTYSMGKLNGVRETFRIDGTKSSYENYVNDLRHGEFRSYWPGNQNQLQDSGRYDMGKKVGYWIYYDLSFVKQREWYNSPVRDTVVLSRDPKTQKQTLGIRNVERLDSAIEYNYRGIATKRIVYDVNSAKYSGINGRRNVTEYNWTTGKVECKYVEYNFSLLGLVTCYYPSGAVKSILTMSEPYCHGDCVWYYENGTKRAEDNVFLGRLTSKVVLYNRSGKVIKKESPLYKVMYDSLIQIGDGSLLPDNEPIQVTQEGNDQDYPMEIAPMVTEEVLEDPDAVVLFAEEMPSFKNGGEKGLQEYLKNNLKYPVAPSDTGVTGTVYIYFEVNKDGSIRNVRVQKGIKDHPAFSQEAVRVIQTMPPWNPGKTNGKAVVVGMTMPVRFEKASPK